MATMNPFDLLGDDAEDPSHLIAAEQLKAAEAAAAAAAAPKKAPAQQNKPAQLPTKPPPPAQAGEVFNSSKFYFLGFPILVFRVGWIERVLIEFFDDCVLISDVSGLFGSMGLIE